MDANTFERDESGVPGEPVNEHPQQTIRREVDDLKRQVQQLWQRLEAISDMIEDAQQH